MSKQKPSSGMKPAPTGKSLIHRYKAQRINTNLLDYDYLDKLSEDEIEWLAQFSSEWVGAASKPNLFTREQLREAWRDQKRRLKDVHFDAISNEFPIEDDEGPPGDPF
jgi:hypothetical protein